MTLKHISRRRRSQQKKEKGNKKHPQLSLVKILAIRLEQTGNDTIESNNKQHSAKRSFLISHGTESAREKHPPPPKLPSKRPPLCGKNCHGYW